MTVKELLGHKDIKITLKILSFIAGACKAGNIGFG